VNFTSQVASGHDALGTLRPPRFDHVLLPSVRWYNASDNAVTVGLGRIAASYYRSSTSYQIC
jgi:hypothetical protein